MKIFIAQHPTEAHIICGLLKQAGIPCEVRGEQLFGIRGEIPLDDASAPYVWLFDEKYGKESKAIIQDYYRPLRGDLPEWQCAHCGEMNEPQFAICWNCGLADEETIL